MEAEEGRDGRILGRFRRKSPDGLAMDWTWQMCMLFARSTLAFTLSGGRGGAPGGL